MTLSIITLKLKQILEMYQFLVTNLVYDMERFPT